MAKAFVTLLPILGLTWVFGLLAVNNSSVVFEYLFAIFNSLQVSCPYIYIFITHELKCPCSFTVLCSIHNIWEMVSVRRATIEFRTIAQVIIAFWLVLAYDLLEDRRGIDVIISKFSFCILKWRTVVRIKIICYVIGWKSGLNSLVETMNRFEKQEEVRKSRFSFREWLKKNNRVFSVSSWARLAKHIDLVLFQI